MNPIQVNDYLKVRLAAAPRKGGMSLPALPSVLLALPVSETSPLLLSVQPLLLKDLRIQCRARGLNPGGSREALLDRVKENMMETSNL